MEISNGSPFYNWKILFSWTKDNLFIVGKTALKRNSKLLLYKMQIKVEFLSVLNRNMQFSLLLEAISRSLEEDLGCCL